VLSKEDFVATVGYQGSSAVVDKRVRSTMKKLGAMDALKLGMFRPGFATALYEAEVTNTPEVLHEAVLYLQEVFQTPLTVDQAKRLLGIQRVPQEIQKTLLV
jgi:hypothetical protein